jgi:carboxyl-terminal processing protease
VRKGEINPLVITVARAVIKVQSVKSKLVEPGYVFVRVTQFQEHTGENLAAALESLSKQSDKNLKGVVLDLRNNPGGLLTAAVAVSSAFLPKDALVVYTEGRTEDAKMRLTASAENYLRGNGSSDYLKSLPEAYKTLPMVVLVNGGSASASEIVAGALQDHKRAVIMGTQSFGKGSVQTILPLGNNTAIKLTTARYYTPGGRSIQAKGIVPDILVEDPATASMDNAFRLREADLDRHLSNDRQIEDKAVEVAANPSSKAQQKNKEIDVNKTEISEFGAKNDYQLNQALNLLKGLNILHGK